MNTLSKNLTIGTIGELLVQLRLLEHNIQAAPPLKDSGNDLIAVRGSVFRAVQVKTTTSNRYRRPRETKKYDILAAVRLMGENRSVMLDMSNVFLIERSELPEVSRQFSKIERFKLTAARIDVLFPKKRRAK